MQIKLNLEKSQAALKLCLTKAGVEQIPGIELCFILDVSGSFEDEHEDGTTNNLLTRLVPWGMTFDPDKKLDVLTFSAGPSNVQHVGAVTADNYDNYIPREIVRRVKGWGGGTDYSYVLEEALRVFGWLGAKKRSIFARLSGMSSSEPAARRKSLAIFLTDGDNTDEARTMQVLRESEQRGDQVYFLFIGISNQRHSFPFLRKVADAFHNTGFFHIEDLKAFIDQSDERINESLLIPELVQWLKA